MKRLVALAVFIATPVRAEDPYQPPPEILYQAQPPASDIEPQPLALSDAIQLAARQNLGIELVRQQVVVARAGIGVAWGRFEPSLTAFYGHSNADVPPPITLLQQGVVQSQLNLDLDVWNVGLTSQLPTGAQLNIGWTNLRTLTSASNGMPLTDPLLYNSGLTFTLTQPLLKGFAFDMAIPQANILRARFATKRAALDVRAALIATVKATEDAYWDLLGALKEHEVRRNSFELARQQRLLTEKQIELGILPRSELIAAESTLARRELTVIEAEAAITRRADRLRGVLNLPRSEWTRPLVPVDPPRYEQPRVNLDESMVLALKNRPELAQAHIDIERASLDLRVARSDRLPALDVGAGYGLIGQQASYKGTLDQMASNDVRTWSVWASFAWSPLMVKARAQVAASLAGQRVAEVQLEQQKLGLLVELRDELREIETAARQVHAAARFRELATRALDVEQRKFQDGGSNNFMIGERQDELAQAQVAELGAVIRHRKANTALEAGMGTLIESRGVRLDVASP